jgi:hypothetical protein
VLRGCVAVLLWWAGFVLGGFLGFCLGCVGNDWPGRGSLGFVDLFIGVYIRLHI